MDIMSEVITLPAPNEISSKILTISNGVPNFFTTASSTSENFKESLCLTDNLITEIVNSIDSTFSNDKVGICDKLRTWSVEFNVSHNYLNKLLFELKSEGLDVPKDVRILMNTPTTHNIWSMKPGAYVHFDIKQIISSLLHKHDFILFGINDLKLGVNVDGLPISKSSKSQFCANIIKICFTCWHLSWFKKNLTLLLVFYNIF